MNSSEMKKKQYADKKKKNFIKILDIIIIMILV